MNVKASVADEKFFSRNRLKTVLFLSAPILAAMITHNLMGLIDVAMIGRLGNSAQAAIGVGAHLFFLLLSLILGISAGVQAMVARRIGEGKTNNIAGFLNAGICLGIIFSIIMILLGYLLSPIIIPGINSDLQVSQQGLKYFHAVLPCGFLAGLGVPFSGFWTGIGKPHFNFFAIAIQLVCNVLFNYALIFGNFGMPRMEIAGAGLGTTLAACVGVLVQVIFALVFAKNQGFLKTLPSRSEIKTLCQLSVPTSIQQFLYSLGILIFIWIVGMLGTQELAVFTIVINILMVLLLLSTALGTASTTLVGNAMGQKQFAEAKQWGWEISLLGAIILLFLGSIGLMIPKYALSIFSTDPSTIAIGITPFRIIIIGIWIECVGRILALSLVGAGAAGTVLKISFTNQWFLRLPLYWLIGVHLEQGLVGIFLTTIVMYSFQTFIFANIWHKGKWADIRL